MSRLVSGFLRSRAVLPAAVVATALLALPALRLGFIWDDLVQRDILANAGPRDAAMDLFRFVDPATMESPRTRALLPWWTAHDLRLSFWRPLSALTRWADYRMVRDDARLQHLHSIAWGAALTLMAGLLYRRLLGPGVAAGIATLLFAVDDAHAQPIAWLANRNSLVASVLALAALLAHDSWRRRGWRAGAFVGPALFACALLGGEFGAGIGPFLLAYALFLDPEPNDGRRWMTVVPYVSVGIVWQASYSAMGFGAAHSGMYVDPLHSPMRFLQLLPRSVLLLLESQFGPIPADVALLCSAGLQHALLFFCGLVVLVMGAALGPLVRRDRRARFLCFGMLVSLLPVCAAPPMARLLLLSGFGAFGLLGLLVSGVTDGAEWMTSSRWRRFALRGVAWAMVVIHGPLAALLFPVGIDQLNQVDAMMVKEPARTLPVGPQVARQHLVCVATPGHFFFVMTLFERKQSGLPSPAVFTGLATGSTPVRITRVDDVTLRLEPDGGFFSPHGTLAEEGVQPPPVSVRYANQVLESLFRAREVAWHVGDGRDRDGVAVRVTALTTDGRPAAIEARFAEILESPAYAWIVYEGGRYQAWTPPAVGETTRTRDVKLPL
jgi:hypothetical protein